MADDVEKCDHAMCKCAKADESDYCSPYCEAAEDVTSIACECGHAGCGI